MNQIVIWLLVMVVFLAIEAATLGLTTIWFAGGALLALITSLFTDQLSIQIAIFFVTSLILVFFTRPIALKHFNRNRERTNVESIVGKQAIVIEAIDNLKGLGQVTVDGREWSARSWTEKGQYPVGAVLRVVAINGVKLIVKEVEPEVNTEADT
ncbi:MAG: NfeD family protein [Clostridium sp.]|nr:NfeD family protein [Clostridium sp.]